jgi:hypothetical protein
MIILQNEVVCMDDGHLLGIYCLDQGVVFPVANQNRVP